MSSRCRTLRKILASSPTEVTPLILCRINIKIRRTKNDSHPSCLWQWECSFSHIWRENWDFGPHRTTRHLETGDRAVMIYTFQTTENNTIQYTKVKIKYFSVSLDLWWYPIKCQEIQTTSISPMFIRLVISTRCHLRPILQLQSHPCVVPITILFLSDILRSPCPVSCQDRGRWYWDCLWPYDLIWRSWLCFPSGLLDQKLFLGYFHLTFRYLCSCARCFHLESLYKLK